MVNKFNPGPIIQSIKRAIIIYGAPPVANYQSLFSNNCFISPYFLSISFTLNLLTVKLHPQHFLSIRMDLEGPTFCF